MRILLFSQPGHGSGGVETVVRKLQQGFRERGHIVQTVYEDDTLPVGGIEKDANGISVHLELPPTWKGFLRPHYTYSLISSLVALYRILRTFKPDVVNYHYCAPSAACFALLRVLFGYRFVVSFHGSDALTTQGLRARLVPYILEQADVVTAVSQALSETVQETFPGGYTPVLVPNGIDYEFWSAPGAGPVHQPQAAPLLVSVGALKHVKGHDMLIDAFSVISRQYPDSHLVLIGDGPLRTSYEEKIAKMNLADRITVTGWLQPEEVRAWLRESDLFVFPSRSEGFGIALVEAMAVGVPVIASNAGGIPEVVGDLDDALVNPVNSTELLKAITALLENRKAQESLRVQVQKRASNYCFSKTVNTYLNEYKRNLS
mgnify:CR=1 FL=1